MVTSYIRYLTKRDSPDDVLTVCYDELIKASTSHSRFDRVVSSDAKIDVGSAA